MIAQLAIEPWLIDSRQAQVRAAIALPDDEEIVMSRVVAASQSRGQTTIALGALTASLQALLTALSIVGVEHNWDEQLQKLTVVGMGLDRFVAPTSAIDIRGELAVAGLLVGLSISRPCAVELWVDAVVCDTLVPVLEPHHNIRVQELDPSNEAAGRSMVLEPRQLEGRPEGVCCRDFGLFSWVKQAVLLAGLRAGTPTIFEEDLATPDHLERALLRSGAPIEGHGSGIILHPPRDADALAPQVYEKIGSLGLVLPVVVAALASPHGELVFRDVSVNPTRAHVVPLLRSLGLDVRAIPEGDRQGEPIGQIRLAWGKESAFSSRLPKDVTISGETALRLGDGLLSFTVLAASVAGNWHFSDYLPQGRGGDARIKGRVFGLLRSAGAQVDETESGFVVQGRSGALNSVIVTSGGDPRLVLLATALALRANAPSQIDDVECLRQCFGKWVGTLKAIGAKITVKYEQA